MTKILSMKLSIILVSLVLLLSIIALLLTGGSTAWFAENDTVEAQGMSISVRDEDVSCTLLSLGVLDIDNGVYTFENATDAETGERVQNSELPMDDPNGISYSQYRKALVLELSITVETDRPTQIRLVTPNTGVSLAQNNFFSNCITVSNVTSYTENTVTKGSTTQSFVTVNGTSTTKVSSLLLYDGTVPAGEQPTKLYFIIEYNDVFLDYINQHIMNTPEVNYFEVGYYHDVTLLIS